MPVTIGRIEIGLDPQLAALVPLLAQALTQKDVLDRIEQKVDKLLMTDAELKTLLTKVDDTTNKLAANVQAIADVDQKISDEIDALLNQPGNQLTPEVTAQLQSFADRLQATSDASDAQVAVLQAIAAKGAPVVPPPPPPPPVG